MSVESDRFLVFDISFKDISDVINCNCGDWVAWMLCAIFWFYKSKTVKFYI